MNIDVVAEAIRSADPFSLHHNQQSNRYLDDYRKMAEAAIEALGLMEESYTAEEFETKSVSGGEGVFRFGGLTSTSLGYKTYTRLTSPWVRSE